MLCEKWKYNSTLWKSVSSFYGNFFPRRILVMAPGPVPAGSEERPAGQSLRMPVQFRLAV